MAPPSFQDCTLVCPLCGYTPGPERVETCPKDGRFLVDVREYKKRPKDRYLGTCLAGKYSLTGILGMGGMSTVYRGIQEPVGRPVAVKVVSPEIDDRNAIRERFQREAKLVARLQHPNIVALYDFGLEPDGTLYMVTEMIQGCSLSNLLKREGALGLVRSLRYCVQILAALSEAHSRELVHRDMKPENIMLSTTIWGGEQVKVLDFGIARVVGGGGSEMERLTQAGVVFGTPHYMSPEQVAGSDKLSFSSDIYSLGIVFFEMLTGDLPFVADSLIEVMIAHRTRPLPRLPGSLGVPKEIEEVLRQATLKDPAMRFQNAAQMLKSLEAAAARIGLASVLREEAGGPLGFSQDATSLPKGSSAPRTPAPAWQGARFGLNGAMDEPPRSAPAPAGETTTMNRRLHSRATLVVEDEGSEGDPAREEMQASFPEAAHPTLVVEEEEEEEDEEEDEHEEVVQEYIQEYMEEELYEEPQDELSALFPSSRRPREPVRPTMTTDEREGEWVGDESVLEREREVLSREDADEDDDPGSLPPFPCQENVDLDAMAGSVERNDPRAEAELVDRPASSDPLEETQPDPVHETRSPVLLCHPPLIDPNTGHDRSRPDPRIPGLDTAVLPVEHFSSVPKVTPAQPTHSGMTRRPESGRVRSAAHSSRPPSASPAAKGSPRPRGTHSGLPPVLSWGLLALGLFLLVLSLIFLVSSLWR